MKESRQKIENKVDLSPAGKMELEYAKKLGILVPEGATKSDVKAMIAIELDDDQRASESLLSYARMKGMKCSDYIGNKALHNQLFDNLNLLDQIIFFGFCIYKFYMKECNENLLLHPLKEEFEAFGDKFKEDGYFICSMQDYIGEELTSFGKSKKVVNGKEKNIYGGSAYTRAHKEAYDYFINKVK